MADPVANRVFVLTASTLRIEPHCLGSGLEGKHQVVILKKQDDVSTGGMTTTSTVDPGATRLCTTSPSWRLQRVGKIRIRADHQNASNRAFEQRPTRPPRPQATGAGTGTSCKPSSVRGGRGPTRGDHVSGAAVADGLLHATRLDPRITGATASRRSRLLALARGGVCRAPSVTGTGGALLPHRFTLACDRSHIGGLFSVALSLTRSPRAGGCYPPPSSCRARTFLASAFAETRSPARRHDSSR